MPDWARLNTPPKIIEPEDAAAELLRRRKARENFADYVEYVSGKPVPKHGKLICRLLHEVMDRKIKRLMICLPPGHMKSWLCSHHFPAFYLSKFKEDPFVAVTHTESFSETWGRKVRNLIMSTEHQALFPGVNIAEDSRAAARWDTTAGGSYFATGVGGAVTGKRARAITLDDLLRGQEDANSSSIRDNQWQWLGSDLMTRMMRDCVIVFITTRWHLGDVAGRLIAAEQNGGEKWRKLILPAIAGLNDPLGRKEGEALWPDEYPIEALERIKAQPAMTPRMWESLYQQSPILDSGNVIKRQWFKIWAQQERPRVRYTLQSYDTAVSTKDKSAFSVALTFGVFDEADTGLPAVILMSRWRGRVDYPDLRKRAQRLAKDYLDDKTYFAADGTQLDSGSGVDRPPDRILVEDAPVGKPLISDLRRAGLDNVMPFQMQRYGDKDSRIMLVSDIFESGRFYVLGQAPSFTQPLRWCDEYIQSMTSYPASDSRDDVDATSQALIFLRTHSWIKNTSDPVYEPSRSRQPVTQRARLY